MMVIDAMVNDVPSWGYLVMLAAALLASMRLADGGLRLCSGLLTRVRRPHLN